MMTRPNNLSALVVASSQLNLRPSKTLQTKPCFLSRAMAALANLLGLVRASKPTLDCRPEISNLLALLNQSSKGEERELRVIG